MTKEEFIEHWKLQRAIGYGSCDIDCSKQLTEELDSVIQQAIAEHDQVKWLPYPENVPILDKVYWTMNKYEHECDCYGHEFDAIIVIAFHELPSSYKPIEP